MNKLLSTTALVVALAFSGAAYAHEQGEGEHKGPPFMEEALSKMPEKDAAQFRSLLKESREKDKALFEQMHELHEDLYDIMTAETFDKAAYIAKSKELGKLHDKMHAHMTDAFAKALSKLSQDERTTLADAMKKGHHGPHHDDAADDAPPADDSK